VDDGECANDSDEDEAEQAARVDVANEVAEAHIIVEDE